MSLKYHRGVTAPVTLGEGEGLNLLQTPLRWIYRISHCWGEMWHYSTALGISQMPKTSCPDTLLPSAHEGWVRTGHCLQKQQKFLQSQVTSFCGVGQRTWFENSRGGNVWAAKSWSKLANSWSKLGTGRVTIPLSVTGVTLCFRLLLLVMDTKPHLNVLMWNPEKFSIILVWSISPVFWVTSGLLWFLGPLSSFYNSVYQSSLYFSLVLHGPRQIISQW